jgi:hypothetical protein
MRSNIESTQVLMPGTLLSSTFVYVKKKEEEEL